MFKSLCVVFRSSCVPFLSQLWCDCTLSIGKYCIMTWFLLLHWLFVIVLLSLIDGYCFFVLQPILPSRVCIVALLVAGCIISCFNKFYCLKKCKGGRMNVLYHKLYFICKRIFFDNGAMLLEYHVLKSTLNTVHGLNVWYNGFLAYFSPINYLWGDLILLEL